MKFSIVKSIIKNCKQDSFFFAHSGALLLYVKFKPNFTKFLNNYSYKKVHGINI